MANITDAQMQVLINCIGAVETGGQVYGQRRYDDYTSAYTNSSAEDSITIGAFAEFRGNAKALLKDIEDAYPDTFKKYDNAGISSDLNLSSWSGYNPAKTSAKAKAIVSIISSDNGKKIQDKRIVKLLNTYISYAESLGVTNTDALFMCANFIHQGGNSACKRIIEKTSKPYTLDNLYNSTLTDTGNQVGAYRTRQQKMYTWIKQYVSNVSKTTEAKSMTEKELRQKPVDYMKKYIGISEGSTGHKEILAVFNNSGLCPRYKMTVNDAWCATTVSSAMIASGLAGKSGSGSVFECVECGCGAMINLAKAQGIWVEKDSYVPTTGDIVLYDWDDGENFASTDNVGYPEHVGTVVSCNGSTIKVIEGNKNNTVGYRDIAVNGRYIRGFIVPKYSLKATSSSTTTSTTTASKPATTTTENKAYVGKGIGTAKALSTMNVRTGSDTTKSVIGTIVKDSTVEVLEITSNGWLKIVYTKASVGYAYVSYQNGKYFTYTKKAVQTTSTGTNLNRTTKWTGVVTADVLNVRTWAGTENTKCSFSPLAHGTKVGVCDTVKAKDGSDWYYINYNNKYGFVHSGWVSKA